MIELTLGTVLAIVDSHRKTYSHLLRRRKLHRFRKDHCYNHCYLTNTNKF